jgi:SAM-dependent methyltransferase
MNAGQSRQSSVTEAISLLRQVDILMAQGQGFAAALKAVDVLEADYIKQRADYEDLPVAQVRRLYAAEADGVPAADPGTYVGATLTGLCPVCGRGEGFVDFEENLRESGRCLSCGSSNRQRQMALIIRLCLGLPDTGELTLPRGLRVHNTESTGAIHNRLHKHAGYAFSEYWGPRYAPGQTVHGIPHEDMQSLSLADNSVDLFLSSDVLEHMPRPYQAHAEVFRVLKPGGRHIFTAPFHGSYDDNVRARLEGGEIAYFGEKLYHGDPIRPDEGVLVWTIFGAEMLDRLRAIGFHALLWKFSAPEYGIVGDAVVFEARKPGGTALSRQAHLSSGARAAQYVAGMIKRLRTRAV